MVDFSARQLTVEEHHGELDAPVERTDEPAFFRRRQEVLLVKAPAQLPLVDPDFRFVERRPQQLHGYARGLLEHLRRIRAGEKARGYPIATIKSAAVWLIEAYAETQVAPAPDAAQLIAEIVQPDAAKTLPVRRSSEAAYLAAIKFEAGRRPDTTGNEPSVTTLYAIAKHVLPLLRKSGGSQKTAEGIVKVWRRLPHYRANVALQRPGGLRVKT